MTTTNVPLTRIVATADVRAALVTTSLCVSAGVHAALATMHAGGTATSEFALFLAAAIVALIGVIVLGANTPTSAGFAACVLISISAAYVLSRLFDLPILGRQPIDLLGVVSVGVQLVGATFAVTLVRKPGRVSAAPLLLCGLIVAYSFLAAYAIPSVHHASHSSGHSHASTS